MIKRRLTTAILTAFLTGSVLSAAAWADNDGYEQSDSGHHGQSHDGNDTDHNGRDNDRSDNNDTDHNGQDNNHLGGNDTDRNGRDNDHSGNNDTDHNGQDNNHLGGNDTDHNGQANDHSGNNDTDHNGQGHQNHTTGKVKLQAGLFDVTQPGISGKVSAVSKPAKQKFSAELKLPLPSNNLNLATGTDAADASLSLLLARNGETYATCDFDLKTDPNKRILRRVEYKIEIVSWRNGAPVAKFGNCVDNQGTVIVPAVVAGDTATVAIDSVPNPVLTVAFGNR